MRGKLFFVARIAAAMKKRFRGCGFLQLPKECLQRACGGSVRNALSQDPDNRNLLIRGGASSPASRSLRPSASIKNILPQLRNQAVWLGFFFWRANYSRCNAFSISCRRRTSSGYADRSGLFLTSAIASSRTSRTRCGLVMPFIMMLPSPH